MSYPLYEISEGSHLTIFIEEPKLYMDLFFSHGANCFLHLDITTNVSSQLAKLCKTGMDSTAKFSVIIE